MEPTTNTNANAVTISGEQTDKLTVNEHKVHCYAEQITTAIRTTQQSILHLAAIVHDARKTLNKKEWRVLGERTFGSAAQLSRYLKIGERLAVLERHKNALPKSLTAMYRLASHLSSDQIQSEILSGAINALSTNADVGDVIERVTGKPAAKVMKYVKVDPSSNVVSVVVNTSPTSQKQIQQNPMVVAAALTMIKRALADLSGMGFEIPEDTIKNLEELTIDVRAQIAA